MIASLALAAVIANRCDWSHPGADPTTSTPSATLAAMGIDSPELAAKIAAGEYSELVTIRRNDARIWGMSSGNAKWCAGEVDTSKWAADDEEQARVYRLGNLSVVVYWRCHNLSFWTADSGEGQTGASLGDVPVAAFAAPAPEYMDAAPLIHAGPIGNGPGYGYALLVAPAGSVGGYAGGSWGGAAGGGGGFVGYQQPPSKAPPPCPVAPPVPEPSTWALMLGGILALVMKARAWG